MYTYLSIYLFCRVANRNETSLDAAADATPLKEDITDSTSISQTSIKVNGANNSDAFASNQTIEPVTASLGASQPTNTPATDPSSSQFPETNTTTSEVQLSTSPETQHTDTSVLPTSIESTINAAVDDTLTSSAVPPIVAAHESDLRNTSSPLLQSEAILGQPEELHPVLEVASDINSTSAPKLENLDSSVQHDVLPSVPSPISTQESSVAPLHSEPALGLETSLDANTEVKKTLEQDSAVVKTMESVDIEMGDASQPLPPTKIAREREDDDDSNQPSAKRSRTEDTFTTDSPIANGASVANGHEAETGIPEFQAKEIIKILKAQGRNNSGKNFIKPVAVLWPDLAASYAAVTANPIDFETMERKLSSNTYSSIEDFKRDINLLVRNTIAYNGEVHVVTAAARAVQKAIFDRLEFLPREPTKKKDKKAKRSTPVRNSTPQASPAPAASRQPRNVRPVAPPAAAPTQTFALDPNTNLPMIRRDSTKTDGGRPKREIHPPKNKDLPYSTSRPKKNTKHAAELKFCREVINELLKTKHFPITEHFLKPVDPVALNIPSYFTIIKKPMDLSTIDKKLSRGEYANAVEFEKDMKLMLQNCFKFNPEPNYIATLGHQLEDVFKSEWDRKDQWMANHAPPVASPDSADEEDDEEEYEDAAPEASSAQSTLSMAKDRLLAEQSKLLDMMNSRVTQFEIDLQQNLVDVVKAKVAEEEANEAKRKKTPKSRALKSKKLAPAKRTQAGTKQKNNHQKSRKRERNEANLSTVEKETISQGIQCLPDDIQGEVLLMIKAEQDDLEVGAQSSC